MDATMMGDGDDREQAPPTGQPAGGTPAADFSQAETLGPEIVRTMRTLRDLLVARASALDAWRLELETGGAELRAERVRLDRDHAEAAALLARLEAALTEREEQLDARFEQLDARSEQLDARSEQLDRLAGDLETLRQDLESRNRHLQTQLDAATADRTALERGTAEVEGERNRLEASRAELAEARAALASRELELDRAAEARQAEITAEWQARARELDRARENVALLQAQLEAELSRATHRQPPPAAGDESADGPDRPAADSPGTSAPSAGGTRTGPLERIHRLSRDARRRATGD